MSIASALNEIKKIDVNNLDVNNLGAWPIAAKVIACIIVLTAVLVAGWFLQVQEQLEKLEAAKAEEVHLKEEFASKQRLSVNLEAYQAQVEEMENIFGEMLRQLPTETEVPGLLEDINRAALSSDLELEELKLLPELVGQFYIELPIQIAVVGEYHNMGAFISATSSLARIVTLHDFSIRPLEEEAPSRLRMDILAKTYRYENKEVEQ